MFKKSATQQQVDDLYATIKTLRERLEKVECATEPFRVGEFPMHYHLWASGWTDPRPQVSHQSAITMLMDHAGLRFEKIPGTPERIVLAKPPKEKANVR